MTISADRRSLIVLTLGTAQTLAWGSTYYLPAILAAPMAQSFGVTTDWIYGIFSAAMLLPALIGPAVGHRIDRFGGRDILSLSSLVFAAGLALLGAAPNLAVYTLGWFVIGTGMGMGLYEAAFSTLTAIYGRNARNAITGITLLAGLASTVCWPLSAVMEAEWGWRMACFVWAAAHLVIALPVYRLMIPRGIGRPAEPVQETTAAPAQDAAQPAAAAVVTAEPIFSRAMILLALAFAVTWITSTAMAAHLPRILEAAGATKTMAIAAAAMVGPAQVAGRILEFGVLQRFHPLLSARLASITHPIGAVILLLVGGPACYLFAILHGAGNGVMTIAKGTLPLAIFGPVGYGRRQGWLAAPARFGQAGAPYVFALLFDHFGADVLMVTGGLCLLSLAALLLLRMAGAEAPAGA